MSREFKFRAWLKSENYYLGKWKKDETIPTFSAVNDIGEFYSDDDLIIEQYTGLKDENGKEIYEGDILVLDKDDVSPEDYVVITFSKGCFRTNTLYENELGEYISNWCIVGNIHENPELLGGKE